MQQYTIDWLAVTILLSTLVVVFMIGRLLGSRGKDRHVLRAEEKSFEKGYEEGQAFGYSEGHAQAVADHAVAVSSAKPQRSKSGRFTKKVK